MKLLVLTSILTPYRTPVFDHLAGFGDIALRVVYLSETEPHRSWTFDRSRMDHDHTFLQDRVVVRRGGSWIHLISTGLRRELVRWEPHVVVAGGWDQGPHVHAFLMRSRWNYRFAWWVESNARDVRKTRHAAASLKRAFAARADGVIVPGQASRQYVASLGVDEEAIHVVPNVVDTTLFRRNRKREDSGSAETTFLFVGRLEPVKGVQELLAAFDRVDQPSRLVLVGAGSLREALFEAARRSRHKIEFRGHLQQHELALEYQNADIFVFPSLSDPWGLVLNEALAAGLPVITTSAPGAVDDLIEPERNGLIVPPGDVQNLARAMNELARHPGRRIRMAQRSFEIGHKFTVDLSARRLRDAVMRICGKSHCRVQPADTDAAPVD